MSVGADFPEVIYDPATAVTAAEHYLWHALASDGSPLPSGSYNYTATLTGDYPGSFPDGSGTPFPLTLQDSVSGRLIVNNKVSSPFGVGWTLSDLDELHPNADGSVTVIDGSGATADFQPGRPIAPLFLYNSPGGDINGLVLDSAGNLYISRADYILRATPDGNVTIVAGGTHGGYSGDGGPAAQALLSGPTDLAFDGAGNLYILDAGNQAIRVIDRQNTIHTLIATIYNTPASGEQPAVLTDSGYYYAMTVSPTGDVYFIDDTLSGAWELRAGTLTPQVVVGGGTIVSTAPMPATSADISPNTLAYDSSTRRLFIDDSYTFTLRTLDQAGTLSTFGGGGNDPLDGVSATSSYYEPGAAIAVGADGSVVFAPSVSVQSYPFTERLIQRVEPDHIVHTIAGGGLPIDFFTGAVVDGSQATVAYNASYYVPALAVAPDGSIVAAVTGAVGRQSRTYTVTIGAGSAVHSYSPPRGESRLLSRMLDGTYSLSQKGNTTETFDPLGRLLQVSDANGNVSTYDRDSEGRLTAIHDPGGIVTTLIYNGTYVSGIKDNAGRYTQLDIDSSGDLVGVTHPDSARRVYAYQGHALVSETSPMGLVTTLTYGSDGLIRSIREPDGGQVQFGPGDSNALLAPETISSQPIPMVAATAYPSSVTRPMGGIETYQTDSAGFPIVSVDPSGRTIVRVFDDDHNLTKKTMPDGSFLVGFWSTRHTPGGWQAVIPAQPDLPHQQSLLAARSYFYDNTHDYPKYLQDERTALTTVDWDDRGNPVRITDDSGNSISLSLDRTGLPLQIVNRRGFASTFGYDAEGNTSSITDAAQSTRTFSRDLAGNIVTVTDARKNVTRFGRDAMGRITSVTLSDGHSRNYTYDLDGNLSSYSDENGQRTSLTYSPRGQVATITDAAGGVRRFSYNFEKALISSTDQKGNVTSYSRDNVGRLTGITLPSGAQWQFGYDVMNNVNLVVDPEGRRRTFQWNSMGLLVAERDAVGTLVAEHVYSPAGDEIARFDGLGKETDFNWDLLGLLTSLTITPTDGSSPVTYAFDHDANGNLIAASGPRTSVHQTWDALDRVQAITEAPGTADEATITFGYDAEGNLTSVTNGSGSKWQFSFDVRDRLASVQDPESPPNVISLDHDPAGNLVHRRDAKGQDAFWTYDALNQWRTHTFPGDQETASYDEVGHITSISDGTIDVASVFDQDGRLATQSIPALNRSIALTYDKSGLRTGLAINGGLPQAYAWDPNARLSSVTSPSGAVASFAYDMLGRITHQGLPNSVSLDQTYDGFGRLARQTYTHPIAGTLEDLQYAYTSDGLISASLSLLGLSTYGYDNRSQLTSVAYPDGRSELFVLDKAGNRVKGAYGHDSVVDTTLTTYTSGGRLIASITTRDVGSGPALLCSRSYTSDANGNVTSVTSTPAGTGATPITTTFTWNGLDQLAGVTLADGTSISTRYYPASPLRLQQVARDGTLTQFLHDPGTANILQEIDATGHPSTEYLHGLGMDEALARTSQGATLSLLSDQLYTPRSQVDASGSKAVSTEFRVFGAVRSGQDPGPVGFAGGRRDPSTGLIYLRNRMMDPVTGRFLSPDPLGFAGGINLYAYAHNNPVNLRDPSGMISVEGVLAFAGVAALAAVAGPALLVEGAAVLAESTAIAVGTVYGARDVGGGISEVAGATTAAESLQGTARTIGGALGVLSGVSVLNELFGAERGLQASAASFETRAILAAAEGETGAAIEASGSSVSAAQERKAVLEAAGCDGGAGSFDAPGGGGVGGGLGGGAGGGNVGPPSPPRLFPNLLPELFEEEMATAESLGVRPMSPNDLGFGDLVNSGTIKFVVTESGDLLVAPHTVNTIEISHAILSGGAPVLTAGQAEIAVAEGQGIGIRITNFSGHFKPSRSSLAHARRIFAKFGIIFP